MLQRDLDQAAGLRYLEQIPVRNVVRVGQQYQETLFTNLAERNLFVTVGQRPRSHRLPYGLFSDSFVLYEQQVNQGLQISGQVFAGGTLPLVPQFLELFHLIL